MKLHVVGPGVVGKATGEGFRRFGHEIVYTDKGDDHSAIEAQVHFICTPEDVVQKVVELVVDGIKARARDNPSLDYHEFVAIRATIPPGTTAYLARIFKFPIVHNPESLREAVALFEFLNSAHTIIGSSGRSPVMESVLDSLYQAMNVTVYWCSSTESEVAKLLVNSYLASLISFWNDAQELCTALAVNSHRVARLVALDPRVSHYGAFMHGTPYGGRCLPKDVSQTLKAAERAQVKLPLLEAVREVNRRMGGE